MKEKGFKTKTGSLRIYGAHKESLWSVNQADANKVGIYVVRKRSDSDFNSIDQGASTELTPNQARKVAERLVAWADAIEAA